MGRYLGIPWFQCCGSSLRRHVSSAFTCACLLRRRRSSCCCCCSKTARNPPPLPEAVHDAVSQPERRKKKKKAKRVTGVRLSSSSAEGEMEESEETETLMCSISNSESEEADKWRSKKKKKKKKVAVAAARLSVFQRVEGKLRESFAVVKKSEHPFEDFKRSMMEMITEKEMFEPTDLEQLLHCFLSLNHPDFHPIIVQAFSHIWHSLFSTSLSIPNSLHQKYRYH